MAAAVVRGKDGWEATGMDLAGVADVEEVADRLRDVDPHAVVSLLFVEADDTYLAIMRLEGEDLRLFGSDAAFGHESRLGSLLVGDLDVPAVELDRTLAGIEAAVSEGGAGTAEAASPVDPVGDAELLADLGVPGARLLALCGRDGMLPADVTSAIAHALGCGDEVDEFRDH